jgi:hypothetical protein
LYRDLLWARHAWPALAERIVQDAAVVGDKAAPCLTIELGRTGGLHVWANLSPATMQAPQATPRNAVALLSTAARKYGGDRCPKSSTLELAPFECIVWGPVNWPKTIDPPS